MPFVKGHPKYAGAGRIKGQPTKLAKEIAMRMESLGCDPVQGMIAMAMDTDTEPAIRARLYSELIQYVYPKLRATDHRFVDGDGNDRGMAFIDAILGDDSDRKA